MSWLYDMMGLIQMGKRKTRLWTARDEKERLQSHLNERLTGAAMGMV